VSRTVVTKLYALIRNIEDLFDAFVIEERKVDDASIEAELEKRRELRKGRKFEEADAIRDGLQERGIIIEDTPDGTRWWLKEA